MAVDARQFVADVTPQVRRAAGILGRRFRRFVSWEDLCQEGLLAAFLMAPTYDASKGLPWTFCWRRCHGAMIDFIRTKVSFFGRPTRGDEVPKIGRMPNFDDYAPLAVDPPEMRDSAEEEFVSFLREVDRGLGCRDVEILTYRYVTDQQLKEIGAGMGISESRVSQVHTDIIERLRGAIARKGLFEELHHGSNSDGGRHGSGSKCEGIGEGEDGEQPRDVGGTEAGELACVGCA